MNRKKITNGLLSACICATMALSAPFNVSAKSFVSENFDKGMTSIRYRKNTASGTVTDALSSQGFTLSPQYILCGFAVLVDKLCQ